MSAAVVGITAAQIAAMGSQSFATGGIVGGTSFAGDKVLARVNSGEMILNSGQQRNLFEMINKGQSGAGSVTFEIKGDRLVGILQKETKRSGLI